MRHPVLLTLVVLAVVVEMAACLYLVEGSGSALLGGGALHVAATLLSLLAARRRRPDLSRVEADLVLLSALAVPLFGPSLAWSLPRLPAAEEEETAHEIFEKYSEHVKPALPDYERTLFTGDYEKDLARELDAESYHEVLRHGSTDQKRNALLRLAQLGEPKHFELIRKCLLDLEHEVRLYAYSELERASRTYEQEIAGRARELKDDSDEPAALLAMARSYLAYAASGIHDEQMAAFYFRSAERYASDARRQGLTDPEAVWIQARALGRLDEFEAAKATLNELAPDQQNLPESCITRAELAYRRRDFVAARAEAERLREAEAELPPWLAALEVHG
ncbi:MAG: hypothetical protein ACYTEZ_03570 [Planctomycetota bacterium]|jgi:hypothetical protein